VCWRHEGVQVSHIDVIKHMCGHLAKRTLIAFNMGAVGINSRSVGVIITPVYMQVISLKLQDMGTANPQLKFERTHLLPLVDEAAFDALVEDEEDKQYLMPQLFPRQNSSPSSDIVPKGMHYLWEHLHSSKADLGLLLLGTENQNAIFSGKDYAGNSVQHSIGQLLGYGKEGLAYEVDANKELIVKASLCFSSMKREFTALQMLGKGGTRCQHIPDIKGTGRIQYTIRDTPNTAVPALWMAPRGIPAVQHLSFIQN
jgi:hypothetical protein